jgi:hypothetical protein
VNWDPISSAQAKNRDEAGVSPRRGRILKGEKPGELPVQQSTKVEMFLKPQDRQGARPYYPAPAARPCRRGDRIAGLLLRRVSPLLAQSGHTDTSAICPLSGQSRHAANLPAGGYDEIDPKRTSAGRFCCDARH